MSGLVVAGLFLAALGLGFGLLREGEQEGEQEVPESPQKAAHVQKGGEK